MTCKVLVLLLGKFPIDPFYQNNAKRKANTNNTKKNEMSPAVKADWRKIMDEDGR